MAEKRPTPGGTGAGTGASGSTTRQRRAASIRRDALAHLNPDHRALIRASGIADDVALERAYQTIDYLDERERLAFGFSKSQWRLGMILPLYWGGKDPVSYQMRPNKAYPHPTKPGKFAKYKTRSGDPIRLDCHPRTQALLADPEVELWVTEGVRKADAVTSRGQLCIALTGVWNGQRDKKLLPDWDDVALEGRSVLVVFDSDTATNVSVAQAQRRLARMLAERGARVSLVVLPPGEDDAKVGLDDFLAAGGTLDDVRALAEPYSEAPAGAPLPPGYVVPEAWTLDEKGVERMGKDGPVPVSRTPIAPVARLVGEDGREAIRLTWRRDGQWREDDFDRDILATATAGKIVTLAGVGVDVTSSRAAWLVEYLAESVEENATVLPVVRTATRLGWYGAGADTFAASATGPIIVRVGQGLNERLAGYRARGTLDGWRDVIDAVADYEVALLGVAVGLAPVLLRIVGVPPFVVDLSGPTGSGKTSIARIPNSVWGAPELIATWRATRVAIERRAGMLAGLPLVVDETQLADYDLTELIYEFASGEGKGRGAKTGGTAAQERWESVLFSTGEQPIVTFGRQAAGVRGRVVTVHGRPFPAGSPHLADALRDGLAEHYGVLGPAFAERIAGHPDLHERIRERYRAIRADLRAAALSDIEGRRAEYVAVLALASKFAHASGLIPWVVPDDFWRSLLVSGAGTEDDDRSAAALLAAWSYAGAHAAKFWSLSDPSPEPHDGWKGRWDEPKRDARLIGFRPDVLHIVLERAGFQFEAVKGAWKERGWLACDKNRVTKKVKMPQGLDNLYVIKRRAVAEAISRRPGR